MTKSDQICTFVQWYRKLSLYRFTDLVGDTYIKAAPTLSFFDKNGFEFLRGGQKLSFFRS